MMELMTVSCGTHGERVSAVVCQHLMQAEIAPLGFVENSNEPNDLQAWCHLCEQEFQKEGDMTDAFRQFNGMAIVCVVCYEIFKVRHTITVIQ